VKIEKRIPFEQKQIPFFFFNNPLLLHVNFIIPQKKEYVYFEIKNKHGISPIGQSI